jgi:hypothetical protein
LKSTNRYTETFEIPQEVHFSLIIFVRVLDLLNQEIIINWMLMD